jgi:hypothetical protein
MEDPKLRKIDREESREDATDECEEGAEGGLNNMKEDTLDDWILDAGTEMTLEASEASREECCDSASELSREDQADNSDASELLE